MTPLIHYIADAEVDDQLDLLLRHLLLTCFTKPGDEVFRKRRFFHDPPTHRWYMQETDRLIAHVAAHEKTIIWQNREIVIGGIAEVCVHPDYRRKGFVKMMLSQVHRFLRERGLPYAALCGDEAIYRSSGYRVVENLFYQPEDEVIILPDAMVCELGKQKWPAETAFLVGNIF